MWCNKIFLLLLVFGLVSGEECGISNAKLCLQKCNCWQPCTNNATIIIDCVKKDLNNLITQWPNHTSHLVASFAHNPIKKLSKIPESRARTISLTFKNCSLEELENELFKDAVNIEYVDLSWNLLNGEDLHPDVFKGPYNNVVYEPIALLELDLSHNNIQSLDGRTFEHTPNLNELDLSYNPLKILDDSSFKALMSLQNLNWLFLINSSLTSLPEDNPFSTAPIVFLELGNNELETVPKLLSVFGNTLKRLHITGNPITELNDQSFLGLKSLYELQINQMPNLRYIKHNTFSGLKNLEILIINDNKKLSHINDGAFGQGENQPPLEEIYMMNNNLRSLSYNLYNWSRPRVLRLEGNHWACECIHPPCSCSNITVTGRNLPHDVTRSSSHIIFVLIIVGLIAIAGLFVWRILVSNRRHRVVNSMYPVIYTSAPISASH